MDDLLKEIDFQSLLSSSVDLTDPTTSLTTPDLRLLITKLDSHSLQIKNRIRSYILSHHDEFSSLFSHCNDTVKSVDDMNQSLSDFIGLRSDRPIDAEIKEVLDEIKEKKKEAREKREVLKLVTAVIELGQRLGGVEDGIKSGRLRFAADEIRELKEAVRIGHEEEREPLVYGVLRKEWFACFEEIQEVLLHFVTTAVIFESDSKVTRVKIISGVDGIDLLAVLEAMEVVGFLEQGLGKIADQIMKFVISPFLVSVPFDAFGEEIVQVSHGVEESTLTMMLSADHKILEWDGESSYIVLSKVLKFIYNDICFQNGVWMHYFGRLMWPQISELIISNFLSKAVPEDASKLIDFHKIITLTSEFELSLKGLNFIPESNHALSTYAENVEIHFAARKKRETLVKARRLMCDFSTSHDVSSDNVVDLLFVPERCVVSKTASLLMELVHQTLKDACLASPFVAVELYHATRDAILLYEAIIPVKLEKQLNGIDIIAALVHNDCLYLSQEILGLAFEYRPQFPLSIRDRAVFVDIAPRFSKMAEDLLERQVQHVIFNLGEAVDGADGFQNTHQLQKYESAKFSIDQVVFILEKVHLIWEPLLLPTTYKKCMCRVLESVLSRVTRDILLLDDMAAEETLQLQLLINLLSESLSSLLESVATAKEDDNLAAGSTHLLYQPIPSWLKLRKLAELLDMPLKSITETWESGELADCGFESSEVKDFIRAIFTDSPLRKECLRRIDDLNL